MITALLALCLLSQPAHARTVKISGQLGRDIYDYGFSLGASDGGMGHVGLEIANLTCTKELDGNGGGEVRCTGLPQGSSESVTISTKGDKAEEINAARGLRNILIETTNADRKLSPTKRELKVKSVTCRGVSAGHDFDELDYDAGVSCDIIL